MLGPRRAALFVAAFLSASACHPAGVAPRHYAAAADTALIARDIDYLASDALEGRATGTPGNDSAAAYLARTYARLGLRPAFQSDDSAGCADARALEKAISDRAGGDVSISVQGGGSCDSAFFQHFIARSAALAHAGKPSALPTQNIVALLPGRDPALRGQVVVVGAHFDHLGRSTENALDPQAGDAIRHGADDNASGTAAVAELARIFSQRPTRRSLVFVNFSGEELGDLGSEWFVNHPPVPLDSVDAMLNFDMVGRLRQDQLIVYGIGTATEMRALVDSANTGTPPLVLRLVPDGYGPSDHASFYEKNIPVLHFFTDLHEDYHRASDVASKINVPGEARVIALAERITRAIADRPARLSFKEIPQSAARLSMGPANDTWFGSVPDMGAADVVGVRLSGVTPGSPADKAGAQKGDIIVEFGGHAVKDIYDYTDAIRAHRPGDVVQVVVDRGGQRVTLTATLGRRGT